MQSMGRALAAYQSEDPGFHTFDSKYDAYLAGRATLTDSEMRGLVLFNNPTKGNCNACHVSSRTGSTPALFTDFTYDNVGIPRNWSLAANQEGTTLPYVPKNGVALGAPNYSYYDLGICGPLRTDFRVGGPTCGRFKVPTLRNIALTPPYFHNGVFQTLDQVVAWYVTRDTDPGRWYVKADGTPDVPYNDLPIAFDANVNVSEVPYNPTTAPSMTSQEMSDLVHFLCTLTDGFDPAHPSAYNVPAQCQSSTADSVAAARINPSRRPEPRPPRRVFPNNPITPGSHTMKRTALSAAAAVALMGAGAAHAATSQQLEQKLDAMAAQIEALRAELKEVRAQNAALASQQQTQAKAQAQQGADLQNVQQTVQTAQLAQARPSPLDNLTLWGYGEANYSRPTRNADDTKADLARAVFGIGYRVNDTTRFNSEFEIEHGVTSSSDAGSSRSSSSISSTS